MTTKSFELNERRKAMAPLSDSDIERIAQRVKKIMSSEFDLEPKDHYDQHSELAKMAKSLNGARGILTRVFLTMIGIGGILLAAFSVFGKKMGS